MSQKEEIQILNRILHLIKRHRYNDNDGFAVFLARVFVKNKNKSSFIKEAAKIQTSFFRFNGIEKSHFLDEILKDLMSLKIFKEEPEFPKQIHIDHIDSFTSIRGIKPSSIEHINVLEKDVEHAFRSLTKEPYTHKHSGSEYSDCLSTRFKLDGKRITTAVAFNGRGKINNRSKGLTTADCGKNGDQIQRLFDESATLFIVQSIGRIHRSVHNDMYTNAYRKSEGGKREIYYCLIDGNDTERIIKAAGC